MGFSEAVAWWDEWQVRVLALASLFLQYFLFVAAPWRKRGIPPWFRFLIWLAYLGSDAVAIYALAALFNHNRKLEWVSAHRSSASVQALWAPILLLHLGGQDSITAYNLEDNELWKRHVVTALSQVTVAIYVFRKSWSAGGDKKLWQAAFLIFIPGILKCLEKPWALKNASINSIVNTPSSWMKRILEDDNKRENPEINSLHEYVEAAANYVKGGQLEEGKESDLTDLFVDLASSYSERLGNLKFMLHDKSEAHTRLRDRLSKTFDRLYTKYEVYKGLNIPEMSSRSCWGGQLRSVVVYLTFAAIGLFHKSRREDYNATDVKITYTLLCCTAALEYISSGIKPCFDCCMLIRGLPWPDQVAQHNLVGYLARNRKHKRLRKLASLLVWRDYLDQLWCMKPCRSSSGIITDLVLDHVAGGWKNHIRDAASYHSFNDNRGQYTLEREGCGSSLEWSLRKPFDESVLLWHLATDFCFYNQMEEASPSQAAQRCSRCFGHQNEEASPSQAAQCCSRCFGNQNVGAKPKPSPSQLSREISNYMAYLLFVNPKMLMAGARSSLFRATYTEMKKMLVDDDEQLPQDGGGALTRKIIGKVMATGTEDAPRVLVPQAWNLAQKLMAVGGPGEDARKKMWTVIQGVWVEMLCFSASRCSGYLHAKSLGNGGEYLSYVWLLLSYMGMETLAERMQRTDLPQEGNMAASGIGPTATTTPATATVTGDDNA